MRKPLFVLALSILAATSVLAQQLDPTLLNKLADQVIADAAALKAALAVQPPPTSVVVRVAAGGNLQAAVDAAAKATTSTTILVPPGSGFGDLVLRAKPVGVVVTIKADTTAFVPGVRVLASQLGSAVRISSLTGYSPIRTEQGACNYTLDGLAPQSFGSGGVAFIAIGSDAETDPLRQPCNIMVTHAFLIASTTTGGKRGIELNGRNLTVRDSHIAGFGYVNAEDSQCAAGWNAPGPFLFENNFCEASSENIMFGGSTDLNPLMSPRDVTIRGNYFTKALSWRGKAGVIVKTSVELKNTQRGLVENNVIENAWGGQGQEGNCVLFTPRDDQARSPWTIVADIEFRFNVVRHCAGGVSILGVEDAPKVSGRTQRINIHDNLFYDLDPLTWKNPNVPDWGSGRTILVGAGPKDVSYTHNTVSGKNMNSIVSIYGGGSTTTDGLVVRDSVFVEGSYGIAGDSTGLGRPAFDRYAPDAIFSRNVIWRTLADNSIPYGPQTNTVVTVNPLNLATMKPTGTWTTTDGKPAGADVDQIKLRIPGLDLTK